MTNCMQLPQNLVCIAPIISNCIQLCRASPLWNYERLCQALTKPKLFLEHLFSLVICSPWRTFLSQQEPYCELGQSQVALFEVYELITESGRRSSCHIMIEMRHNFAMTLLNKILNLSNCQLSVLSLLCQQFLVINRINSGFSADNICSEN